TEKVEILETKVAQTVEGVSETVENVTGAVKETVASVSDSVTDTVGAVKDTVQESVDTVKEMFDIRLQVERHPWLIMGGSALLGFLLEPVLRTTPKTSSTGQASAPTPAAGFAAQAIRPHHGNGGPRSRRSERATTPKSTWFDYVQPELTKLKGLALGV